MNFTPDDYVLESSKYIPSGRSPFAEKRVVYQNDLNNGSYSSNQINYDLQQLATNGSYNDWKGGYIVVPEVLRLTRISAITGFDALDCPFAVGLKNDYATIFNSIQINIANMTIAQQTQLMPCLWNARKLLSWSQSFLTKKSATLGFWPDSTDSFQVAGAYTGVASPIGTGVINNFNLPQFPSALNPQSAYSVGQTNWGFFTRQKQTTAFNPNTASVSSFQTEANFGTSALNYYKNVGQSKLWYIYAIVPLAQLHPFFKDLPLAKGIYSTMILNTNQCVQQLSLTIAGGVLTSTQITSTNASNGICPFLIANGSQTGNGFAPIVDLCIAEGDGTYTFEVALSIGKDSFGGSTYATGTTPTLTQTRIYMPTYKFQPDAETQYLANNTYKMITYSDYQLYSYPVSVNNGVGSLNQVITNGTDNVVRLWILPYANNTYLANGSNAQAEYASPFSTAPATCLPYAQFTNFQVYVSGKPMFNENINYTFQTFIDEISGDVSLNAGLDDMITSGLINQTQWSQSPWIVVDISRRLESERLSPKQIQVQFNVLTTLSQVQVQFFLEYQKSITLDVLSGAISPELTLSKA